MKDRVPASLLLLALLSTASPKTSAAGEPQTPADPAGWARLALAPCETRAARTESADARLGERLPDVAQSREQLSFPDREREQRRQAAARQRAAGIARLDALLYGGRMKLPPPSASGGRPGPTSFRAVAGSLLNDADACALDAVETTILFSVLGLPFEPDRARLLGASRQFLPIQQAIARHVDQGRTLEQAFEILRPPTADPSFAHLEAVVRAVRGGGGSNRHSTEMAREAERRLRQLLEVVGLAAEPVRVQTYLHWKIHEIEGAIGVPVPEAAYDQLSRRARAALYGDVAAMRRLQAWPPAETVAVLTPLLDRWFRTVALPDMRKALSRDPFAAYWFFVQSGGVAGPGPVFRDSRVTVRDPGFLLSSLETLTLRDALARGRGSRVPGHFVDRHGELERAFTAVTLSAQDALERIDRSPADPGMRAKLRAFVETRAGAAFSSLDVYSAVVRDASRIAGRVDRDLAGAALDLLHDAKRERLDALVAEIAARDGGDDPRLAPYLATSGALMLELERRQAKERRFQQRTSGAFVGWLLSQFMIGGGVPVELWAPGGVLGAEFAELVDEVTPKNARSGNRYEGKPAAGVRLVHGGREYHAALVDIVERAANFLNISAFDWKTDVGGRDIAYRLMAKKLGIDGALYEGFLARFRNGLPIDDPHGMPVFFYDIPTARLKDLLVWYFFMESGDPRIVEAREAARAAGATLECAAVKTCGDLRALFEAAGDRFGAGHERPESERAWRAYQQIGQLFAARPPGPAKVRRRRALRDYVEDPAALRRFVRRFGLKRADRPDQSFPINIVADSKQTFFNLRLGERSPFFPYLGSDPIRDVYLPLLEFDIRVVLWKGPLEFPWRIGGMPLPGRKILGVIPMPFVPWPWIGAVPGFGWAGPVSSLFLQYLLASDPRVFWAMVNHTKSWSNESVALESGMGMGSKYFNLYDEYKTWHDMGVVVHGPPVADVNDHFVQVFNEARVNNTGIPSSRGVPVPRLEYADYRYTGPGASDGHGRTWLLTTHPEQGDSNYRGVFMAALAAARRSIHIENSFFSDPLLARMLMRKAREFRGRVSCDGLNDLECARAKRDAVRIHLVLPDSSDKPIVDAVGTADFYEMLHLGIKIHRWGPAEGWSAARMLHTKAWLIDYDAERGGLAYVGAANATQRSHLSDNEAGILTTSPAFAREVHDRLFQPDLTVDSRVEPAEGFHVVWGANPAVRASRWLRRLLVDLFWFI